MPSVSLQSTEIPASSSSWRRCADTAGHCARKGECGQCVTRLPGGEVCVSTEDCEVGLVCDGHTCKPALGAGAPCEGQICGLHGWCVEGTCTDLGREGAECSSAQPCDGAAGYACVSGTCEPLSFAQEGEVCGVTAAEPRCSYGTACIAEIPLEERTCVAQPTLGEPCPEGRCRAPFLCSNGTCGVLEPSFCN